jgi:hypothetical protein
MSYGMWRLGGAMLPIDDPRFRLNHLLTRYEARTTPKEVPPPAQPEEEALVEAFDRIARDVIRPAMEEIGAELERRSHKYEMLIVPGRQITMHLYPAVLRRSAYAGPCCPYVAFWRDATTAQIHVVRSTIMPNGKGRAEITDTLPIDEITRHYVETQILDVLGSVLGVAEG